MALAATKAGIDITASKVDIGVYIDFREARMAEKIRLSATTLKVLRLLLEKPTEGRSGAEISRATKVGSGTLYPLLARLQAARWLTSEWEVIDPAEEGRPRRRFYKLSRLGQANALKAFQELQLAPAGGVAWAS